MERRPVELDTEGRSGLLCVRISGPASGRDRRRGKAAIGGRVEGGPAGSRRR